jgi:hypothetical protein
LTKNIKNVEITIIPIMSYGMQARMFQAESSGVFWRISKKKD